MEDGKCLKDKIMKHRKKYIALLMVLACLLSGCARNGEKSADMTILYMVTLAFSLVLMVAYGLMVQKKQVWFWVLFGSILVVNTGYLLLASAKTLDAALWANRIAYLGSACLPLSMMMIIMRVCRLKYKKWMAVVLPLITVIVFLVAASPGYSDIYYKEVSFTVVDGTGVLEKSYGPWHDLYFVYLLGYFAVMVGMIKYAKSKKTAESQLYATILGGMVFVNVGVWLLEQFIRTDFEILSISYIITEFFLLALCMVMQENNKIKLSQPVPESAMQDAWKAQEQAQSKDPDQTVDQEGLEQRKQFEERLSLLTKTERRVYDFYIADKTTKEVLNEMNITENTLKYHNRNIYGKLGVSSRKQLKEIGKQL